MTRVKTSGASSAGLLNYLSFLHFVAASNESSIEVEQRHESQHGHRGGLEHGQSRYHFEDASHNAHRLYRTSPSNSTAWADLILLDR